MSQMKTTLTLNDDEYDVTFDADVQSAEPMTRDYPGSPSTIENTGIISVIKYVWDEDAKKYTKCNLPEELFKNVWDELDELLNAKVEKSGLELLEQLAEQMGDRYDD